MKKIAIIVDAVVNLPHELIAEHGIFVVPFHIATKQGFHLDQYHADKIEQQYDKHLRNKSEDYAKSVPLFADEIESLFLEKIVTQYDQAIFITIASSRSELHKHVTDAWFAISTKCFKIRRELGLKLGFELEIIDSGTVGPGQGLLAYAASEMVKQGHGLHEIKAKLLTLRRNTYIYGIPDDILYMYTRAKEKNENSITWGKYTLATMFDLKPIIQFNFGESNAIGRAKGMDVGMSKIFNHLSQKIREGLLVDALVISFSGNLNTIKATIDFNQLCDLAKQKNIQVMLCKMSLTMAINLGENAIMAAFAADSSVFES